MKFLQLTRLDSCSLEVCGEVLINPRYIVAINKRMRLTKGYTCCSILLVTGTEYYIALTIEELLEQLNSFASEF